MTVIWKIFRIVLWLGAAAYAVAGLLAITGVLGSAREADSLRHAYAVFGYQSGPNHSDLAIWIYCDSEGSASKLSQFMNVLFAKGPSGRIDVKGKDVSFTSDVQPQPGDSEWFEAVFRALDDKNWPK